MKSLLIISNIDNTIIDITPALMLLCNPDEFLRKINDLKEVYSGEEIFHVGALIEPMGCAYNGMFIAGGGFKPGAAVVVYGSGPMGLGAVASARIARLEAFNGKGMPKNHHNTIMQRHSAQWN